MVSDDWVDDLIEEKHKLEIEVSRKYDEIQRLREAGDWMWEAISRHDNTRECPQCQDMIRLWKEVRGE